MTDPSVAGEPAATDDDRPGGGDEVAAPPTPRWRRRAVLALVIVATLTTFVASVAVWSHRVLLNTDEWVSTVGPLAEDPAVTDALAIYLVDQITAAVDLEAVAAEALPERAQRLAVPLTDAIDGFLTDQVRALLQTEQFRTLWVAANRYAHTQVVRLLRGEPGVVYTGDGTISLNLVPLIAAALDKVERFGILPDGYTSPQIDRSTPPDQAVAALSEALGRDLDPNFGQVEVFDDHTLAQAQTAVRLFDRLVVGIVVLAVGLAVAALVLSTTRRRTALQLGVGLVAALVVAGAILRSTTNWILSSIHVEQNRSAAAAVLHRVLASLGSIERVVLAIGLVLVVGAWLAGTSASATRARALARRGGVAADPGVARSVGFVAAHRDGLAVAVGVVAVGTLLLVDVTFGSLLVIAAVAGGAELALWWSGRAEVSASPTLGNG